MHTTYIQILMTGTVVQVQGNRSLKEERSTRTFAPQSLEGGIDRAASDRLGPFVPPWPFLCAVRPFLPAAKPRRSMDHKLVIGGRGVVSFSVPNKFVI